MTNDKRIVLTLDAGGTNFVFSAICNNEEIVEPVHLKAVTTDTEGCLATLVQGFTTVKEKLDAEPIAISFAFPGPADYERGVIGDYIALPWQKIIPVGDITPEHAALIEPMSVGFHAVSRAQAVDTDVVMVIGCGMVGVGAVIRSLLRGAKVIACDVDDEKLDIVKRLGADFTINTLKENVHERLMELTDSMGPNIVIEAVGSPATYQMAVNEVAFCGRVICIGYSKQDVEFTTKYFVQKELDIRGSRNALPEDFDGVIRYLKKYNPPYDVLTSGIVDPEHAEEAMKQWEANTGKVFRILVKF